MERFVLPVWDLSVSIVRRKSEASSEALEAPSIMRTHLGGEVHYDAFLNDEILQDAMMFRLIQISEESRKLSESFKAEHNSVPWSALVGLRNRIVHDYGNVDLTVVYDTLSVDIPVMKKRLQNIRF